LTEGVIIIPCRGRRSQLELTLPAICAWWARRRWSVLVVDGDASAETERLCDEYGATWVPNLQTGTWCKTELIERGVELAADLEVPLVQVLDADTTVFFDPGRFMAMGPGHWGRTLDQHSPGWLLAWTTDLGICRPFERFEGWGAEDWYLRAALRFRAGARCVLMSPALAMRGHGDDLRVAFQPEPKLATSARNTRQFLQAVAGWEREFGALAPWEHACLAEQCAPLRGVEHLDPWLRKARETGLELPGNG
jgi:hypothetical protein